MCSSRSGGGGGGGGTRTRYQIDENERLQPSSGIAVVGNRLFPDRLSRATICELYYLHNNKSLIYELDGVVVSMDLIYILSDE